MTWKPSPVLSAVQLLATTLDAIAKAVTSVQSAFPRKEALNSTRAGHLEYLNAVVKETLQIFPLFAGASLRQVPAGGAIIPGEFIPENARLSSHVSPCHFILQTY